MKTFTFTYDLSHMYGRVYENCMIYLVVSLSENTWNIIVENTMVLPEEEEITLVAIALEEDTRIYLKTLLINTEEVLENIRTHFREDKHSLREEVCEELCCTHHLISH